jgi:hypothetical protein
MQGHADNDMLLVWQTSRVLFGMSSVNPQVAALLSEHRMLDMLRDWGRAST